jgi:hypothetical protein
MEPVIGNLLLFGLEDGATALICDQNGLAAIREAELS